MSIDNVLASVAVRDLKASSLWYAKLFGRAASMPMPEVAEWHFPRGGCLQVYQLPERAGSVGFYVLVIAFAALPMAMCGHSGTVWTIVGVLGSVALVILAVQFAEFSHIPSERGRQAGFLMVCALLVSCWGSRNCPIRGGSDREHTRVESVTRAVANGVAWLLGAVAFLMFLSGVAR